MPLVVRQSIKGKNGPRCMSLISCFGKMPAPAVDVERVVDVK